MRVTLLTVGKLREAYLRDGIAEYLKRLRRFAAVTLIEVADETAPETLSPAEAEQVKAREGERLRKQLRDGQYVIALAINGRQLSSEAFAAHLAKCAVDSRADIALLIGGSLGLDPATLARADLTLSFGPLTFPHQLMRLLALEQMYRAMKIIAGEPYHK